MKLLDIKCGMYALAILSLCSCAHQSSIEPSSAHIDSPATAIETHSGQETLSTTQLSHQTETTNRTPLPADAPDRLFTTKSEREILNALRANQDSAKTAKSSIQGYVKRSDGVVTWWLDNQPMPQHPDTAEINAQKQ